MEVQSWCKGYANASISAGGTMRLSKTYENGFCWGAFSAIQWFGDGIWPDGKKLLEPIQEEGIHAE
jgi:hypothetical protein